MRKLYFFFDIDGTLTDKETKKIVPSAQLALHKLQQAGHFVGIATGRAHYKAKPFLKEVGLHHMVCNGGAALVYEDQLLHDMPLDKDQALQVLQEAQSLGYGYLLMLDDSDRVYSDTDLFIKQCGKRQEPTTYCIDKNFDPTQCNDIYKLYLSIPIAHESRLSSLHTLGHLRFVPDYLMFQHDRKKDGIIEMMQYIQAPFSDIVVFGDDKNDLVMFDSQWTSIAMGNACKELKDKADYVTASNVEDGIYRACEYFHWF